MCLLQARSVSMLSCLRLVCVHMLMDWPWLRLVSCMHRLSGNQQGDWILATKGCVTKAHAAESRAQSGNSSQAGSCVHHKPNHFMCIMNGSESVVGHCQPHSPWASHVITWTSHHHHCHGQSLSHDGQKRVLIVVISSQLRAMPTAKEGRKRKPARVPSCAPIAPGQTTQPPLKSERPRIKRQIMQNLAPTLFAFPHAHEISKRAAAAEGLFVQGHAQPGGGRGSHDMIHCKAWIMSA
mmetsp:Transcript_6640/g.16493  ORF Transcript_6640/g.16493 Transcript_6640/m.16493 type:complete len:238 (+) Transcript_6640:268-981(+)